jgi:uncharacterized membrane protein
VAIDDTYDELFDERDRRARERRAARAARAARGVRAPRRVQGPRRPRRAPRRLGSGELAHLLEARGGRWLVGIVAAIAALTVVGLLALWPYHWHPHGASVSATLPAHVDAVTDARCPTTPTVQECRSAAVTVQGRRIHLTLGPVAAAPAVDAGDAIRVSRATEVGGQAVPEAERYAFVDVDRRGGLLWLGLAAVALTLLLLRRRGLLAVAGVVLSLLIVWEFLVPGILTGHSALLVALVASLAVTFVTLVLTNGLGAQTLAAALGISVTLVLACGLAEAAVAIAQLDGKSDDVMLALGVESHLSLTGVVLAAMLVGALGVLADTAVTQASAVMALRRANPGLGVRALYREAFAVGRDHLSATIHTLVLAYTGAALPLLLVMRQSQLNVGDALNAQTIAEPIAATIVGCLALIAAVPLTTSLAASLVVRIPPGTLPEGGGHGHAH